MKKTLQVKNYPIKEIKRLKQACIIRNCDYVDIVVKAVKLYLKNNK